MGSFEGHVIPGVFFVIYGSWWMFTSYVLYFWNRSGSSSSGKTNRAAARREYEINKRSWLSLPCFPRLHLEPLVKVVLPIIGIIVELLFDVVPDPEHEGQTKIIVKAYFILRGDDLPIAKLQHATMYAFFMVSGMVDLLSLVVKFPKKTGQLFLSIAFWMEGLLFYFHVGGREMLDVRVHYILTLAIFMCAISALARLYSGSQFLINVCLAFSILYQGVWFIQAANIMYGRNAASWDWEDHHHSMLVALIATWHFLLIAIFMLSTWTIVHIVLRCRRGRKGDKKKSGVKLLPRRLRMRMKLDSDDDDVEAKVGLMGGDDEEGKERSEVATGLQEVAAKKDEEEDEL
jgi:hypothetical protein